MAIVTPHRASLAGPRLPVMAKAAALMATMP
jgi:hypothetical protein